MKNVIFVYGVFMLGLMGIISFFATALVSSWGERAILILLGVVAYSLIFVLYRRQKQRETNETAQASGIMPDEQIAEI